MISIGFCSSSVNLCFIYITGCKCEKVTGSVLVGLGCYCRVVALQPGPESASGRPRPPGLVHSVRAGGSLFGEAGGSPPRGAAGPGRPRCAGRGPWFLPGGRSAGPRVRRLGLALRSVAAFFFPFFLSPSLVWFEKT